MYKLTHIKTETDNDLYTFEDIFNMIIEANDEGAYVTLITKEKDRIIEVNIEMYPFKHKFKFERIEYAE